MTKKQEATQLKEEAREALRRMLPPGARVATHVTHISRSGMSRDVRVFVGGKDDGGAISDLTGYVANACGYRRARDGWGIVISGCGFDAGFQVVHDLAHALYRDGFGCIGEGCPSNDHSNGDRDYTPHNDKNREWATCDACCERPRDAVPPECPAHSHWHKAGSYAFKHDCL